MLTGDAGLLREYEELTRLGAADLEDRWLLGALRRLLDEATDTDGPGGDENDARRLRSVARIALGELARMEHGARRG